MSDQIDVYEEELKTAYEAYVAKVMYIAAKARGSIIVPWLQLRGYEFTQGNGTWLISDPTADKTNPRSYAWYLNDNLPEPIERCLTLEVEGTQGNPELGLWMRDFTTRKTKNGGGQI